MLTTIKRGRKGGPVHSSRLLKIAKSSITAVNFRVSWFTGNNTIDESVFHKYASTLSVFTL